MSVDDDDDEVVSSAFHLFVLAVAAFLDGSVISCSSVFLPAPCRIIVMSQSRRSVRDFAGVVAGCRLLLNATVARDQRSNEHKY